MAQIAAVVRPLLQQAQQLSPMGMGPYGFVPLTRPFATEWHATV